MSKREKKKIINLFFSLLIIFSFLLYNYVNERVVVKEKNINNIQNKDNKKLEVHYIDVGQGDSTLLIHNNKVMLIDAGDNSSGFKVVNYIKNLGINKIDYLIGTHGHEDHIGGFDNVIDNFEIGDVFLPNVLVKTKTFETVLDSLIRKNMKFKTPNIGDEIKLYNTVCKTLFVGDDVKDLNNDSIVLRCNYGDNSFLFMADSYVWIEKLIMKENIESDVLKVGHHGSKTSSNFKFLKKVNPTFAVISVGKDNMYYLPHPTTLYKLNELNIKVFRTDLNGNIVFDSDGKNINYRMDKAYE